MQIKDKPTGIPFMDTYDYEATVLYRGTLRTIAMPPMSGQLRTLAGIAANASKSGYNTLYVTMDAPTRIVIRKIFSALYGDVNLNDEQMMEAIRTYKHTGGEVVIYEAPRTSTVKDLEAIVETRSDIDLLLIDNINLLAEQAIVYDLARYAVKKDILAMAARHSVACIVTEQVPARIYAQDGEPL